MTFKKSLLPIAVALSLSSTAVLAESPNYTYIEAGWFRMNLDESPVDPSGYFISGSAELGTNGTFIHGSYLDGDDSYMGVDFDASETSLGLGYKAESSPDTTWHVYADWIEQNAKIEGVSEDESGYALGVGARGFVAEHVELSGDVTYVDIEDEEGFGGGVELTYYFANQFGVTLGGELDDDSNTAISIGLRVEF